MTTAEAKQFNIYAQQQALLEQCDMTIEDPVAAEALLCQLNHYRLSDYWHPMCRFARATGYSLDSFCSSATIGLVHKLHLFDEQLRHDVSGELA